MKSILLTLMIATTTASAAIVTKTVEYDHGGTKFDGFLAYDAPASPNAAKRPGVLVIPEWWGLNDYIQGRAKQLADMGYVAFVVDMYGGGANTTDATKAKELAGPLYGSPEMAARAQAGLDQLLKTGLVDQNKVAAIGFCFGWNRELPWRPDPAHSGGLKEYPVQVPHAQRSHRSHGQA
jgi:hypothetical protein